MPYDPDLDPVFASIDERLADHDERLDALESGTVNPPDPPDPPDPVPTPDGVDLVVTAFAPPPMTQYQPATLGATIQNAGDEDVPTGAIVGVGFLLDDAQVGAQVAWASTDAGLAAGALLTLDTATAPMHSPAWAPGVDGDHDLTAHVDDTNRVPEAHEDNNRRSARVTIKAAPPRPAGQKLFVAGSLWNTHKIPAAFIAGCDGTLRGLSYQLNAGAYAHPMTWATSSDPIHTFDMPNTWGWAAQTVRANMRDDATPASGTDGHLCLLNADTGDLIDMWQLHKVGDRHWSCSAWARHNWQTGSGFGAPPYGPAAGVTVSGAPTGAGTITNDEVDAAQIPHALCMAYSYAQMHAPHVPPAIANDTGGGGGPLQEGMLLMAQGAQPGGLNAAEAALWTAANTFGCYIVDKADPPGVAYWYLADPAKLGAFRGDKLTAIGRTLRAVQTVA